jgi:hypothetical protein
MADSSSTPADTELSIRDFEKRIREAKHRDHARADAFATAIRTADINALGEALEALQYCEHSSPWPRVVSAVERLDPPR